MSITQSLLLISVSVFTQFSSNNEDVVKQLIGNSKLYFVIVIDALHAESRLHLEHELRTVELLP